MLTRLLAGAACAALLGLCAPAFAATDPQVPGSAIQISPSAAQAIDAFYAGRGEAPLWLGSAGNGAASELIGILDRASLDGFEDGPVIAAQAQSLIDRAQGGDAAALNAADRLLSTAWVNYIQTLERPSDGMVYADNWVKPRQQSPAEILYLAAAAPALSTYIRSASQVNPLYAQLRDAAWNEIQSGGSVDPRVLTSLDRAREMPMQHKYVMVDAADARLYMIDDGRIVDSMKVVVGKPGETTQTPMLASTIYYATVNPYWHVMDSMVRSLIAKNVLQQGLGYLSSHGYQVMPADENDNTLLDPSNVDWHAVAAGGLHVRVRQLPGPANSMGRVKFGFPNTYDIYLHDTPTKGVFAQDDRTVSHGCIRLEDAQRLERWMLDRDVQPQSMGAEQQVPLPTPVPIYVTYLTAQAHDGQLTFVDDIYSRDVQATQVAALR
jgi:L,D-transpeptidase YcbB